MPRLARWLLTVIAISVVGVVLLVWLLPNGEAPPQPEQGSGTAQREVEPHAPPTTPRQVTVAPPPVTTPTSAVGRGTIRGRVYAPDGSAPTHATVKAVVDRLDRAQAQPDSSHMQTVVGADGSFELTGLPFGAFNVEARSDNGFASAQVRLKPNATVRYVVLALEEGLPTGGVVRNAAGSPIAGATVTPIEHDGQPTTDAQRARLEVKTDAEGKFLLPILPVDEWSLYVAASGHSPLVSGPVRAGARDIVLVLKSGIALSGEVIDAETGDLIGGMTLTATLQDLDLGSLQTVSGEDGTFQFDGLDEGRYLIDVETSPFVVEGGPVTVELTRSRIPPRMQLRALTGGTVTGRTYDADTSEGVGGATVAIRRAADRRPYRLDTSGEDGSFEISALPPGNYVMYAVRAPGYVANMPGENRHESPLYLTAGQVVEDIEIPLRRGNALSGVVVTGEGEPVSGVEVRGLGRSGWQDETSTNENGEFVLPGAPDGDLVLLSAVTPDALSNNVGPVEVPRADITLVLELPRTGVIAGQVVDSGGRPLRASLLVISDALEFPAMPAVGNSDANGRFVLTGLVPGSHRVLATPGGGEQRELSAFTIQSGQAIRGMRLVYDEDVFDISGRVTDTQGSPVNASLRLFTPKHPGGFARTRFDGSYTFTGLTAGLYTVEASAPGFINQSQDGIAAGSSGVDFVLNPLGRIIGTVVDEAGRPVTRFEVVATMRSGSASILPTPDDGRPRSFNDPEGRFVIETEPGLYVLEISADGFRPEVVNARAGDSGEETVTDPIVLKK